ncbi:GAF domain-containing protein [Oculatella sp. LEGE 06141]|uniref:histidine kinase dimerization/phosphoacceptor domain -containing protein n=1 Tax=Oculatella sp. LEGE 06141 TaxID=1828648 RepID=UPI0018815191|nr:histidine kinase dimerization/phosphoacceptor domain -containing protein [Oculatella sp. LEGE 06141]MBE9182501.1 GAF domain-containing protein [Oculatella sp. LEGE 06141]
MQHHQITSLLNLTSAIDRRPLKVPPETSLAEVIAIMGKAQSSCNLPGMGISLNTVLMSEARASGILVVDGSTVLGVFAESDALRAIVSGNDLVNTSVAEAISQPAIALVQSDQVDVFSALALLRQHNISHLPVVDDDGNLMGMVTPAGIRSVLQLDELLKSTPLAELVAGSVVQAPMSTSLLNLAQTMLEQSAETIVLTAEGEHHPEPVGVVLRRHVVQLHTLGLDLSTIPAQTVMATPLLRFSASESILVAYWEMQQQQMQRFAIAGAQGELLSIATPTCFLNTLPLDEMRHVAEELQQSIEQFAAEKASGVQPHPSALELQALNNPAELLEQLQCSSILAAMALRIRESLNLETILQTAVDEVRQFLQTDRVIIYRFNPDMSGTVVVESVAAGWRPALNSTLKDTCFGQNYAQAYKAGRVQTTEDIYTAGLTQCHIDILVLYDIRACLVVPILQGQELWGLLCAYHCSGPRVWRAFEADLLKQLATHMAIAIQQSELYQQVQSELVERKRTEEQLKLSLKEKEVLLKEIHHRVKNNLQVISSVLRLQSDYVRDEKVLELFNDSQNRIRSMALIHEKLYQSNDLLKIDFDDYIRDLTDNLMQSYAAGLRTTTLYTNARGIWLNIDTAIPCSLIINELVANSLKHAFPTASEENEIRIDISTASDNRFVLSVCDNGVGLPPNLDFRNTESLGLELVCIFTEQLEGHVELDRTNGTAFTITFSEIGGTGKGQAHG